MPTHSSISRSQLFVIGLIFLISYGIFFVFDASLLRMLTREDGLFEWLGALCFLAASFVFLKKYLKSKNVFFLLFCLACFFAFAEEISWGQRLFGFKTPEVIASINIQKELTVHNLKWINHEESFFSSIRGIISFNRLFILFWVSYCVLLPVFYWKNIRVREIASRLKIPVVSLMFGGIFLINEALSKFINIYLLNKWSSRLAHYEVKEAIWGILILVMSISLEQ